MTELMENTATEVIDPFAVFFVVDIEDCKLHGRATAVIKVIRHAQWPDERLVGVGFTSAAFQAEGLKEVDMDVSFGIVFGKLDEFQIGSHAGYGPEFGIVEDFFLNGGVAVDETDVKSLITCGCCPQNIGTGSEMPGNFAGSSVGFGGGDKLGLMDGSTEAAIGGDRYGGVHCEMNCSTLVSDWMNWLIERCFLVEGFAGLR
jgi:hypothetical protein